MASKVQIANRALSKLGSDRIISFDDDTKPAREISAAYDVVRKAELRANIWNFSVKRAKLPALAQAPAFGFARAFQLPADLLRLVHINGVWAAWPRGYHLDQDDRQWQVEGRSILTDIASPLPIRYVYDCQDTTLYDALFVESFACRLAAEVCEALTQSNTKKDAAWAEYKQAIKAAKLTDAIENPPEDLPESAWLYARV